MTDTKIELGLINDLVKKLEKLENSKESEGSEWSKVQTKDKKTKKSKGGIVDAKIDPDRSYESKFCPFSHCPGYYCLSGPE